MLVIVESPNKVKKVRQILQELLPDRKIIVQASVGHVRDLPPKNLGIDIKNGFQPSWEIMGDKKKVVTEIQKSAKYASDIYLACDPDREGEAIAYHLQEILDMSYNKPCRLVYQSITKSAIEEALQNVKPIDTNIVEAAICRRKLDRLMGFLVSQVLWSAVEGSKSAGRTQSVVLLLCALKEQEIQKHIGATSYKILCQSYKGEKKNGLIGLQWSSQVNDIDRARPLLEEFKVRQLVVKDKKETDLKRNPPSPFITSTLQQSGRNFGLSVKQIQSIAQDLYTSGHITYIRTDMAEIAPSFQQTIKSFVQQKYGDEYVGNNAKGNKGHKAKGSKKSENSQEGHEAIRATHLEFKGDGLAIMHKKVYLLIWKRTVACMMSPQLLHKYVIKVHSETNGENEGNKEVRGYFVGEQIEEIFDGYTKVFPNGNDGTQKGVKDIVVGDVLNMYDCVAKSVDKSPPPRFSDSSLVKTLEQKGVGRPSTFESSIQSNLSRGTIAIETRKGQKKEVVDLYMKESTFEIKEKKRNVEVDAHKKKIFVTDLGFRINEFLQNNFQDMINVKFTMELEKKLDQISRGTTDSDSVLSDFYTVLEQQLNAVGKSALSSSSSAQKSQSNKRLLGMDDGVPIYAGKSKYGFYVQRDTVFASVASVDVSIEDAKEALEKKKNSKNKVVKRFKGTKDTGEIVVMRNDRGTYFVCKGKFYSVPGKADVTMKTCSRILGR